jgi:hypothetical protein
MKPNKILNEFRKTALYKNLGEAEKIKHVVSVLSPNKGLTLNDLTILLKSDMNKKDLEDAIDILEDLREIERYDKIEKGVVYGFYKVPYPYVSTSRENVSMILIGKGIRYNPEFTLEK